MKRILFTLLLLTAWYISQAQEMGYGFKAGLNFSNFQGPIEQDDSGTDLESHRLITGFHIGAIINFKFTDLVGLRTELMFSQKGTRYSFDGPGYQHFYIFNQDNTVATFGAKEISLNVTNAYIDVPVMGYFRATRWLEVSGGASIGALISSIAAGEIRYSGSTASENRIENVVTTIDYNYLNDDGSVRNLENINTEMIGFQTVEIPRSAGAYYNHNLYNQDLAGKFFNRLDLGLVAGINLFLNQGLSLGLRANFGLSDVTNNAVDYSNHTLDSENNFRYAEDKDTNLSLQASIGFSF